MGGSQRAGRGEQENQRGSPAASWGTTAGSDSDKNRTHQRRQYLENYTLVAILILLCKATHLSLVYCPESSDKLYKMLVAGLTFRNSDLSDPGCSLGTWT
jgi:hypothetical protein